MYVCINVHAYVMDIDHLIDGPSINIMHPFFNCLTINAFLPWPRESSI